MNTSGLLAGAGGCPFTKIAHSDSDAATVLPLILILMADGGDMLLIFALLYIIM